MEIGEFSATLPVAPLVNTGTMSFTSVRPSVTFALTGTLPATVVSATFTVTAYDCCASKSSTTPGFRYSPVPLTRKLPASAPASVIELVPNRSSVITMSATLIGAAVLVFSAIKDVTFASATPVGAWLPTGPRMSTVTPVGCASE